MAKSQGLGTLAEQMFAYGDVSQMSSGDTHFEMLAAYENLEWHQVREATERFVERKRLNRARLAKLLEERARHRAEAVIRNGDRIRQVDRWREAGIRERMTLRTIPKSAKWALWALIAGLDFYIFAQVMAYAENIASPGLTDATFWLGGTVGMMVFVVGILLAQAIRRASYFYSQKKLLKELVQTGGPTDGLRLSHYSRWMTYGFGVFYLVFTAGAVVLRYQGGGKLQPGLLLLQTMIPIVGVMLELLIDDPTEIRLPQRTIVDWWLSHRIGKLDMSIALRELITRERLASVSDRYRFERAALVNMHNDVGLSSKYAAQLATREHNLREGERDSLKLDDSVSNSEQAHHVQDSSEPDVLAKNGAARTSVRTESSVHTPIEPILGTVHE